MRNLSFLERNIMSDTKMNNSRIQKWIKIIKEDLGIKRKIPVRSSIHIPYHPEWDGLWDGFARLDKGRMRIEINTVLLDNDYQIVSVLAHEFRHIWQAINGFYLSYKDDTKSEIDANRYMDDFVRRYKKEMRCLKYNEVSCLTA